MTSTATNRLAHETSPYLLQHARNPVDWYPWSSEALETARRLDRPIFLSIGYSACHWCHVMEHESFENAEIAALMNQWFVNIKVDREERPDLDQIYMNAVTALTGQGGWPMSVFLTPDLRPFFGGTYWPPEARWGRPGFREILAAVQAAWTDRRQALSAQADELTQAVVQASRPAVSMDQLTLETLRNAQRSLMRSADRTHGGFGSAPKFPHPMDVRVLLRCHQRFSDAEALQHVQLTLDKMAAGGIYDHLGGGFARYSTDERWLVPHFEKMLYDNALLVPAYLEAYQVTGRAAYATLVRETLDYVLREMTAAEGGFYSTQDADSEGVEGKFFVWSRAEIDQHLPPEDRELFCDFFDVTDGGNWEHHNILHVSQELSTVARRLGLETEEAQERLTHAKQTLFNVRATRIAPGRDEKILASWNGLMIAAMAQAYRVLGDPQDLLAAQQGARFVIAHMRAADGQLWHCFKDGRARFNGYLDDYAAMIDGLVELYQADFDPWSLEVAQQLAERMLAQFWDRDDAGFFYTSEDHETLITRPKEIHDNATPSGNSLAATALIKLGMLTGRTDLREKGLSTLQSMAATLTRAPMAAGQALIALDLALGPAYEVAVCGGTADEVRTLRASHFLPRSVFAHRPSGLDDRDVAESLQPLLTGKSAAEGMRNVYICREGQCLQPVTGDDITPALRRMAISGSSAEAVGPA